MAAIRWSEDQFAKFERRRAGKGAQREASGPAAGGLPQPDARESGFTGSPSPAAPDALLPIMDQLLGAMECTRARIATPSFLARHPGWPDHEYDHQVLFFETLDTWADQDPVRRDIVLDIIGTPNGGLRLRGAAGRLKQAGARKGVPDIEVFIPSRDPSGATVVHALLIEMKRPRRLDPLSGKVLRPAGKATPEQTARLARLVHRGYRAEVAYGAQHALLILGGHLERMLAPEAG